MSKMTHGKEYSFSIFTVHTGNDTNCKDCIFLLCGIAALYGQSFVREALSC